MIILYINGAKSPFFPFPDLHRSLSLNLTPRFVAQHRCCYRCAARRERGVGGGGARGGGGAAGAAPAAGAVRSWRVALG